MLKKLKTLHQILRENPDYKIEDKKIKISGCFFIVPKMKPMFGSLLDVIVREGEHSYIGRLNDYWWDSSWFEEDKLKTNTEKTKKPFPEVKRMESRTLKPLIQVLKENPFYNKVERCSIDFKEFMMVSIIEKMIQNFGKPIFVNKMNSINYTGDDGCMYHNTWFE